MRRLAAACLSSLLLYGVLFGAVLDRPLSHGFLAQQIEARLARAGAIGSPKLVILAGSNGAYSHRCETIEPIVGRPCVNGGIAVGIGLDYLFARWQAVLRPGDVVYLPMEEAQYIRSRAATETGPDAAIMLRHDRTTLATLPQRWTGAFFAFDLRALLMSLIERALVAGGFHDPRAAVTGRSNDWGDHVGHTPALGAASQAVLATMAPEHPTDAQIRDGYGTTLISGFLRWAGAHGVHAIGGLPTGFADSPLPEDEVAAIRAVYAANGAGFLELPDRSRYPRSAFFDTPDHLSEPWQIAHSEALAVRLKPAQERSTVTARTE
jgi:hypothetical protein